MADKPPRALKPVAVLWVDSQAQPGWGEYKRDVDLVCSTVGHLVERTKTRIVVALSLSQNHYGDYLTIPRCAVKSIHHLNPAPTKAGRAERGK